MLGDAGHGVGMEHLNEQRSEPADQHGRQVAVNNARHAVEGEVRLVGIVTARWWFLGQSDALRISRLTRRRNRVRASLATVADTFLVFPMARLRS